MVSHWNRRGISGIVMVLAAVILLLVYIYIAGIVVSASGKNLDNRTKDVKDVLMGFVSGMTTTPQPCEKIGGNGCIVDLDGCKTYCTTTKAKKDGFCSTAKTSCIDVQPCCCVCTG